MLGAGVAGLLAARVLSDFYTEVIVVDRDELPDGAATRRGVPQARHAHALLARGQQVLEDLFPGLTAELQSDGAPTGDFLNDVRLYLSGHRLKSGPTGLVAVSASRALLESHLRSRVRSIANVELRAPWDVEGPVWNGPAVAGVRLLRRPDGAGETVGSDVVVDATGRGSRAGAWLEATSMERAAEVRVPIDVAYATRRYRLGRASLGNDLAVVHGVTPQHRRGGVLAIIEGDQAMVTLVGVLGDRPPTDPDGFTAFAGSLPFPDIADAIADAEAVDEPVAHRFPASVWRRFERLQWLPRGFAILGDAVCSLNPIYGQGMSVAALEALALRHHLQLHRTLHPKRFQRELAGVIAPVWQIAVGGDVMFPELDRERTMAQRLLGAYIARLHAAAARDAGLARTFARVFGLVDSPSRLLRPNVAVRVLVER